MLRVAQAKARAQGASIPFVCQDMCGLRLHKPVDAVCCACDGVNYLTEDGEAASFFKAAYAALRPGGLLLFDVSSAYKLAEILGGNVFAEAEENIAYIWRNNYDAAEKLCEMDLTCFVKSEGLYERFDERHLQRAYGLDELTLLLNGAGFTDIRAYSAGTREPPGGKDERLQFVATK